MHNENGRNATRQQSSQLPPTNAEWETLISGRCDRATIAAAIKERTWQALRGSLLNTSMRTRYDALVNYLGDAPTFAQTIQVTNYINSLKRGGLIR